MARRDDYWYRMTDRTTSGRSASEVVLQSLGINGSGAISADTYYLSIDTPGIPPTIHQQTHSIRYGQSTAITSPSHRGILRRPQGDGRCGSVLHGQWGTSRCPAAHWELMPMWDKIMLRKRCIIETINDMLKNTAQLVHSRHRSVNNFIMNMVASLAAYCFFDNKPQALDGYYIEDTKQLMLFW